MKKQKLSFPFRFLCLLVSSLILAGVPVTVPVQAQPLAAVTTPYSILFVTQFPLKADFTAVASVFGNHQPELQSTGRGGDLWIRYPGGGLKNLTKTAGYGSTGANGFQDHNAIAVRDPSVYWNGTKALFSMVIGAPDANEQYLWETYYWQIYEVTGLALNQTPVITKVPNQPANFNNVSPIYGTDDRIIFTSDRPRSGAANLYPQLDEYEEAPTVTGLWSLDPVSGNLFMLNHAPSGDFTPILDSFGRVIFTQWDHMQRDQQADADKFDGGGYGTFNWSSEAANSKPLNNRTEIYPEPRAAPEATANLNTFTFNQFFPWQINEDGTSPETLNHIGRHELSGYIPNSFNDDPNIVEYYGQFSRFNQHEIDNLLQIKEDPLHPGKYFGIDAPEFRTHASGQVVSLVAPPSLDADHIAVTYVTHRATASYTSNPTASHSGHYRDPLPLFDGQLIAAHTSQTDQEAGGSGPSIYAFRLKTLTLSGNGYYVANQLLTAGISKTVSFWDPDHLVTYSGPFWELQPVEVRARTRPTHPAPALGAPEQQAFTQAGVDLTEFQTYLRQHNLAVIVSHNVTTRDDFDMQQPFNLRILNGVQTIGAPGKIYNIKYLQLFQADQLRGLGGFQSPNPGRRVIAQLMHDASALAIQPPSPGGPPASVVLGSDGSMAAFVPARRAMTWQTTDPAGAGVVRERFWLTFQPGEIRVCASCHGVNDVDQAGHTPPMNKPQALQDLLEHWKGVVNAPPPVPFSSLGPNDGWVLESGENTSIGGTLNAVGGAFNLGDDAANRQYRAVLHFDTSSLPDTAVIFKATLKILKQGMAGTNPFTTHGGLLADIRKPFFGANAGLEIGDFQAAATQAGTATFAATPVGNWYSASLSPTGKLQINRTGPTEFRLRFALDDNNDNAPDFMAFFSGNAAVANQPQLIIEYYVP